MRLNEHTALVSNRVVLVPYEACHVKTYSEWMSDEALREATASERLSLSEEYAMQVSWRTDPDKLTFIAALPSDLIAVDIGPKEIIEGVHDAPEDLIGDVNLFITTDLDEETEFTGEIELMIARTDQQGKGLGKAVLLLFMKYILEQGEYMIEKDQGKLVRLRVKIGKENEKSLKLFGSVGFVKTGDTASYFGEWEMDMDVRKGEAREKMSIRIEEMLVNADVAEVKKARYRRQADISLGGGL